MYFFLIIWHMRTFLLTLNRKIHSCYDCTENSHSSGVSERQCAVLPLSFLNERALLILKAAVPCWHTRHWFCSSSFSRSRFWEAHVKGAQKFNLVPLLLLIHIIYLFSIFSVSPCFQVRLHIAAHLAEMTGLLCIYHNISKPKKPLTDKKVISEMENPEKGNVSNRRSTSCCSRCCQNKRGATIKVHTTQRQKLHEHFVKHPKCHIRRTLHLF